METDRASPITFSFSFKLQVWKSASAATSVWRRDCIRHEASQAGSRPAQYFKPRQGCTVVLERWAVTFQPFSYGQVTHRDCQAEWLMAMESKKA
jgi:hypothetical protein